MPRLLLLLSLCLSPFMALAAEPPAVELAKLLASARSVEAKFEQTVSTSAGQLSQEARGVMSVARPQLFRWDVQEPFVQLIVADGKQVWVYDPDLAQAVVRPFDRQLADTPALLFSGDAQKIGERYEVTLANDAGDARRFLLKPHDAEALFESLRVTFRKGRLSEMLLLDSLGQQTRIAFRDVKLNGQLPASRFVFEPPAGTDVIREGF